MLSVKFCTLEKKIFRKEVPYGATIEEAKKLIAEEACCCDPLFMKLIYKKKVLPNHILISSLELKENEFIVILSKTKKEKVELQNNSSLLANQVPRVLPIPMFSKKSQKNIDIGIEVKKQLKHLIFGNKSKNNAKGKHNAHNSNTRNYTVSINIIQTGPSSNIIVYRISGQTKNSHQLRNSKHSRNSEQARNSGQSRNSVQSRNSGQIRKKRQSRAPIQLITLLNNSRLSKTQRNNLILVGGRPIHLRNVSSIIQNRFVVNPRNNLYFIPTEVRNKERFLQSINNFKMMSSIAHLFIFLANIYYIQFISLCIFNYCLLLPLII